MQHAQLEQVIKEHHRDAFIWARQCCGFDEDRAKDVLQQVYLKILEQKAVYGGKSSVKTWLFSVIRFTAIGSLVQANAILPLLEDYDAPEEVVPTEAERSPEELIQLLPVKQREVLLLVFYHGLTLEKAAEVMEISLGTVRTHYDRGKEKLEKIDRKRKNRKMMKDESEKEIESFFAQLKEQDKAIQIPDFPQAKSSRMVYWWLPVGIAASLVIAAWFLAGNKTDQSLEQNVIIITLEQKQNNELQFRIEKTTELESWESPTSSLLNEF